MRSLTPVVLVLGACLFALPAVAETSAVTEPLFGNDLASALPMSCPLSLAECGPDCIPSYDDCTQTEAISFVRQKPNYVCVYQCTTTSTCFDTACGRITPQVTTVSYRVRSEPVAPPEPCLAPDVWMCTGFALE